MDIMHFLAKAMAAWDGGIRSRIARQKKHK